MADKKKKAHYISGRESRKIGKQNRKITRVLEKRKKRKDVEAEYITEMKDPANILEFDNLHTYFYTDTGVVKAVNGVTFSIPEGSTVGVVGESGCGKSVTSLSLMQLVQGPSGQIVEGSIRFRTSAFRRDENGKKIPVYEETEEEVEVKPKKVKKAKKAKKAKPAPISEEELALQAFAHRLLDANVEIGAGDKVNIFVRKEDEDFAATLQKACLQKGAAQAIITVNKGEEPETPVAETKGEEGKPAAKVTVKKRVQKKNELGGNLYEMEEKVYDIAKMPLEAMRGIRGREIAMIFQEPMTSLNPVFTVGNQLDEVAFLHIEGISKKDAKARSVEMLQLVGIADPEGVYKKFPHELSGGMRQRVMIAMALLCNPRLIIADEPTTALDVTIQAQILDLLREIKDKISGSIMLITHDLGVVAEMADYVVVMYAGKVIEMGTAEDIFDNPLHPYTIGLQKSKPTVDSEVDSLYCIPGFVPNPVDMPNYCYFRDRCDKCRKECAGEYPHLIKVSDTHSVACYLYKDEAIKE